ncbi:uncharacterized protein L201_005648 [Kwoniella dendrophila CBS 6074]|uniref:Uncharacterized protein n=1 Tax=Kwoniella dendrophila CBS 6074 TaxID=1295534 RepID=A0AAX4JZM7_9TREE
MTAPIPISSSSHQSPILKHTSQPVFSPPPPPSLPSNTPGSSASVSPQTPFLAIPSSLGITPTQNTGGGGGGGSSFYKWASSLGKSPTNLNQPGLGNSPNKQKGFDVPGTHADDHDHEHHDSFEFGDLNSRSWNPGSAGGRRTMSLSFESKSPNNPNSPIASMLKGGFGGESGGTNAGGGGGGGSGISPSQIGSGSLQNGVLADKAAKGQGVLRRLSLSGRPAFLSPPLPSAPLPPSPPNSANIPSIPAPAPASTSTSAPGPPEAEPQLTKSFTTGSRGRRFSEGTKKRGVSPMGERILRDHGHF